VIAGLIVNLACMARPVCLPVLLRLWKPKGVTKPVLARQLIDLLARRYPGRRVHVVADAAYATRGLAGLPKRVTLTCRLRANAVLYELAPPRTGKRDGPGPKANGWAVRLTWPPRRAGPRPRSAGMAVMSRCG
jgi:hypothetical protein